MALSNLEAVFALQATFRGTISPELLPGAGASERRVSWKEANLGQVTLNGTSTPAISGAVPLSLTMQTGTPQELDLTEAPQPAGESDLDLTDLRLVGLVAKTSADNAGSIEIRPADTLGYDLWGSGAGCRLPKKCTLAFLDEVAGRAKVDATHKLIEIDGQAGDEIELILFFGF